MPATLEARARTRAFARVIGPFLVIVAAMVAVRMPNIGTILTAFFENPMPALPIARESCGPATVYYQDMTGNILCVIRHEV